MDDLNLKTADELVRLHNTLCAEGNRIDGPWKKSKRALIQRIRALGDQAAVDHAPEAAEETGGRPKETIGALIEALVVTDLPYEAIARAVLDQFPSARTTARSVASVASTMRKRGDVVPFRLRRKS